MKTQPKFHPVNSSLSLTECRYAECHEAMNMPAIAAMAVLTLATWAAWDKASVFVNCSLLRQVTLD